MISLRSHVVSLAAVFLALALGLVLGSTTLSDGLLGGLRDDKSTLQSQLDATTTDRNQLREQLTAADGFDAAVASRIVGRTLDQRTVVVVAGPDADSADRDALVALIGAAGGTVTGQVSLTNTFVDPASADQLRSTVTNAIPPGVALPTGATDAGSLAGALLGSVLLLDGTTAQPQTSPEALQAALSALQSGGFIGTGDGAVRAGQLAVVLTGGAITGDSAGDRAATVARVAAAMDGRGAGTVLAGRTGSADGNGPIGVARADANVTAGLSTVDDVQTSAGRITTVLALAEQLEGRAGRYGTATSAQAVTVPS
ncbi:copper transporter [Rhodococcus aerolatus]